MAIEPLDLPSYCNVCEEAFTIFDAQEYKKGNLITAHHNELRDRVADLAGKSFIPGHMCNDPKIFTGHAVRGGKSKAKGKASEKFKVAPPPEEGEEKGYLLIRDIWPQGTDSIYNMRVVNTDAVSYKSKIR